MKKTLAIVALSSAAAACGGEPPIPPPEGPASLWIKNDSQFLLQELRIHDTPDYLRAANMLDVPMPIGLELLRHGSGTIYVTVVRERFAGGPPVGLTTEEPLELFDGTGYRLIVFDESFRLNDAEYVPRPTLDGGAAD